MPTEDRFFVRKQHYSGSGVSGRVWRVEAHGEQGRGAESGVGFWHQLEQLRPVTPCSSSTPAVATMEAGCVRALRVCVSLRYVSHQVSSTAGREQPNCHSDFHHPSDAERVHSALETGHKPASCGAEGAHQDGYERTAV